VKILSITAGAAGMYCGSCLRDNALAAELLARGHDVTLQPLYTPLLTDEANVTRSNVLFGGISVYLQNYSSLFARLPRFLDKLIDAPRVIDFFAGRSVSTDPRLLGGLTVSMLEGRDGRLRKEFDKLVEWAGSEPRPDIINLTNSMLIGMARPLATALGAPVTCMLQGEDLFLDNLTPRYRDIALRLIREQVAHVDQFLAVSDYYAEFMTRYLQVPAAKMSVVPLAINPDGFGPRTPRHDGVFRLGYFARIAPEKGLHLLADAFIRLRQRPGTESIRLDVAGLLPADHRGYFAKVERSIRDAGLAADFAYHGEPDRDGKAQFLRTLDVFSAPATYDEPKGLSVLEAMATGVPVVQPRRGSYVELVERTGGGLLVDGDADSLAAGLYQLWRDPAEAARLGRQGAEGVRQRHTIQLSAARLVKTFEAVIERRDPGRRPAGPEAPEPLAVAVR
jgi:glycosyltransferase involved in cell wall biosynthesis